MNTITKKAYNNIGALTDIFGDDTAIVLRAIDWYMASLRTALNTLDTEAKQVYKSGRA